MPKQTNPRSLANLNVWQPGSSGNPKGPKRGMSFSEIMVRELEKNWNPDALKDQAARKTPPTNKERIVAMFVARAAAGDLQAFIELMNRTEGKVPDQLMQHVETAVRVVPWDDDGNPAVVYVDEQNATDRGEGDRMKSQRPADVPALPDMYPPPEAQVQGLDQRVEAAKKAAEAPAADTVDAEFTVQAT